jgi:hypothetical protein
MRGVVFSLAAGTSFVFGVFVVVVVVGGVVVDGLVVVVVVVVLTFCSDIEEPQ